MTVNTFRVITANPEAWSSFGWLRRQYGKPQAYGPGKDRTMAKWPGQGAGRQALCWRRLALVCDPVLSQVFREQAKNARNPGYR